MPPGEVIDWIFRGLFLVLATLWGRSQKLADDLVQAKANDLQRIVKHDRDALTVLVDVKAAALERSVSERSHALDRLFESQLARRDERIDALSKQIEAAAERASTAASKLTCKMGDVDHRLTVLETQIAGQR